MTSQVGATSSETSFSQLEPDTGLHIASLLPAASLLSLTAVSKSVANVFCPAVTRIALSKISLLAAALLPALEVRHAHTGGRGKPSVSWKLPAPLLRQVI